jgi:hypothetical protein
MAKEDVSRVATVLLVVVTVWYAWLTSRMTRSMSLQTKAMVQPVLGIEMSQNKDEPYPKGRWQAKNLGEKPIVVIDVRLECRRDSRICHEEYMMYRNHVLPPREMIAFNFDFTKKFLDEQGRGWFSGSESFNVEIVTADISEQVILTYRMHLYWQSLSVKKGMPGRVRWRIFSDPTRYFYRRQKMRIERWLKIDELSRLRKAEAKKPIETGVVILEPEPLPKPKRPPAESRWVGLRLKVAGLRLKPPEGFPAESRLKARWAR